MVFIGARALAEQVLQDTKEDLRVQCSRVEQAFSQRCVELTEAKIQLETKLTQVSQRGGSIHPQELLDFHGCNSACVSLCADFGADRGPGDEHRISGTGHSQQRGSAESGPVQTLPPLPQTQHGALQGSSAAQVRPVALRAFTLSFPPPLMFFLCKFGSGGAADRSHGGVAAAAAEGGQRLPWSPGAVTHRPGEGHQL